MENTASTSDSNNEQQYFAANRNTYQSGESDDQLRMRANELGLSAEEARQRRQQQRGSQPLRLSERPPVRKDAKTEETWAQVLFNDNTFTSAMMHSIGFVGCDERVVADGTLTINRRKQHEKEKSGVIATKAHADYDNLQDLFQQPQQQRQRQQTEEQVPQDEDGGEEEDEDEIEGGSLKAAAFGIIKGTVGPAILYLPRGFHSSGYAVAIPAMIFATAMFIFNSYKLLECWKVEKESNHKLVERLAKLLDGSSNNSATAAGDPGEDTATTNTGYGSTMESLPPSNNEKQQQSLELGLLLSYPELARRGLGKYSFFVEIGIACMQFGVCLTYLIFVPSNLEACIANIVGDDDGNGIYNGYVPSKTVLMWMMIVIEIPLSWIRDIRKLTPTNVAASLLIAFGLASVLLIAFEVGFRTTILLNDDGSVEKTSLVFIENLKAMKPITESWLVFVGTSFFMMEGSITLIVPLQEAVYADSDRAQFPDMNRNVTTWICGFYIVFSLIASAAFGENIQTALTASLTGTLATIVQFAYSIAVILTFPLQAFPAMEVLMRFVMGETNTKTTMDPWKHNVFTSTVTILLGVIAVVAIDYLGNVVSILGSLFGIPLALIFPPLMHNNLVVQKDPSRSQSFEPKLNYAVVVVGIVATFVASYNTLVTWNEGAEG